jgi:arabinosaccharide transport system substrate-binding protein
MKNFVTGFGRAPVALFVIALLAALSIAATSPRADRKRPDLVLAVFGPPHYDAYKKVVPAFERAHNVRVEIELTDWHALENRLQNAVLSGTEVPDMVELIEGSLGFFTRGPDEDAGFLDLTQRIRNEPLAQGLVQSRLSLWTSHEKIYALPHDVHPVMLVYRRDLVEQLGIDVQKLDTWDAFTRMAHDVVKDLDGDGMLDRYALDLPASGGTGLWTLMLQNGAQFFDAHGEVAFDSPEAAQTVRWYVMQTHGASRIAFDCGWGQPLMKAMNDGLALFYLAPDWRTRTIEKEIPNLKGKLAVMPLPAFSPGGRRTSVWGGTGLAISRSTKRPDLAWELAKYLYLDGKELGERYRSTYIIPPLASTWTLPEITRPNPYYSNQPIGKLYGELAPSTPPVYPSPVYRLALTKIDEAYQRVVQHYEAHGEQGLDQEITSQLSRSAAYVRRAAKRIARLRDAH